MLALALVISSITFSCAQKVNAETDWQTTAITAPEEGKLVGAGYMDIVFNTNLEGAKEYKVYFNDELKGTFPADSKVASMRCEVYTTKVCAHTAYVVAALNDGSTVQTATRTFYVSKKGLAMGSDMSKVVDLSKLNMSWYYDWDTTPLESGVADGIDLVPMIWGGEEDNLIKIPDIDSEAKYLLGFNEPDIESQANMTVEDALKIWPQLQKEGRRTVSPVPADPNGTSAWLESFMAGIDADASLSCDAVSLHWYQPYPNVDNILNIVDKLYEKYKRPIWFTEISVVGYNKEYTDNSYENEASRKKVQDFLAELIPELDKREYVERYAWFPYNINSANDIDSASYSGASALFDYETGKFTELGFMYSQLGNPEGYVGKTLTSEDRFVYVEPTTQDPATPAVTTKPTTQAPITGAVKKPAKVNLKKAKNVKKRSVTLSWKKAKNAKKYQVQYSLNKKFKKGKKFKTKIKTTTKVNFKIKKLTKKKTYYFRVRGVNGKVYGAWSKVKTVKIKK